MVLNFGTRKFLKADMTRYLKKFNAPGVVAKIIAISGVGLGFHSHAGQIGTMSPMARHHYDISVLSRRYAKKMGPAACDTHWRTL